MFLNLAVFFVLQALAGIAEVTLNPLFTDHMVLQRNRPVPVYGTASPGEVITIEFAGQTKAATADSTGCWQVELAPMAAAAEPRTLKVSSSIGNQQSKIDDIVVGDVWLCAGQSNMASEMKNYPTLADETASMNNPLIRLFKIKREGIASPEPSKTVVVDPVFKGSWQELTPAFASQFSATAAFFGNALQPQTGIPVGLIYANRGGTAVNQWLPMNFMQSKADLYARYLSKENPWWTEGPRNPGLVRAPSYLYNGTIHPLLPFAIRGIIWYQGESDDRDVDIYAEIFTDLIKVWRGLWGYDFPFLFVQLAPYGSVSWDARGEAWAFQREAQAAALALPDTGIAVIADAGELLDIHPQNKQPVGERLALLAAKLDNPQIVAESPAFKTAECIGNRMRITFKNTGTGLTARRVAMNKNKRLEPGMDPEAFAVEADTLAGFTVCGADKKFTAAQARIVSPDTVEVWSDRIAAPVAVRYGWANFPLCNLYNREGLPASPFRTDHFAMPDFSAAVQSGMDIAIGAVQAAVHDDFNRVGAVPGGDWLSSLPDGVRWELVNQTLTVGEASSSHYVLYNSKAMAEKDATIELSTVISGAKAGAWGGLAFNYQDPRNFYIMRIKFGTGAYQLLCYQNGNTRVVDSADASQPFLAGGTYMLRLRSIPAQGFYAVNISDTVSGKILLNRSKNEVSPGFKSGFAGLYGGSVYAQPSLLIFDAFTFTAGK
jgi:sialate O-acetylesterase